MSVIIRLQNLPWSANALDIRNFFRGLSIPEGGVHIVGGENGDAFIAFSTDEDARQGFMLNGGKIKEIQVKLMLSSRSEMHKVIETARQSVPIMSLTQAAPAPASAPAPAPVVTPASLMNQPASIPGITSLPQNMFASFGIPGLGGVLEMPQPAVIEPPVTISPIVTNNDPMAANNGDKRRSKDRSERNADRDRRRSKSKSRSRSRERKDRKRDRRDRSRSRERRRRDRSRSRDRDRDRKDRRRSRPTRSRSPSIRRNRDKQEEPTRSPIINTQQDNKNGWANQQQPDPDLDLDTLNRLQELGKKRNPNAFQMHNANDQSVNQRAGANRQQQRDCCVAIRNAPNHTSYGDVRRFCPSYIDKHGIKMINDELGRRTGNILVKFCEARSKMIFLQRKHFELKGQAVVVEHLDDEAFDAAIDSYLPYRRDGQLQPEIPIPEEPVEFTILKLDELPFYIKEHDVMKVLGDYSLLSIVLKDNRSERTRTAYVQFAKSADAKSALQHKEMFVFGRKPAVVTSISEEEFELEKPNPVIITQPEPQPEVLPQSNLGMFGMMPQEMPPAPSKDRQVVDSPPAIQTRDPRQRRNQQEPPNFTGPFGSSSIQSTFSQTGNGLSQVPFGNFSTQLRPIWGAPSQATIPPNGKPNVSPSSDALDCILIKGLPQVATDRTIVEFLQETGSVPARIHLMLDAAGARSGDCFCEFRTEDEARRAATRHGAELAGHRVTVDPVPRSVVEDALEGPRVPSLLGDPPTIFRAPIINDLVRGPLINNMRLPLDNMRPQIDNSFIDDGYGPMDDYNRGPRGMMFDRNRGRGRGKFDRGMPRGRGRGMGMGRGGRFDSRPPNDDVLPAMEDFGAPGCVVSMENVPFRATVDDILQFFSEFDLTQDDVIRRFNDRGQPTGDARVAFKKPFDAQRAVKTRHMDTILDRRISLNII